MYIITLKYDSFGSAQNVYKLLTRRYHIVKVAEEDYPYHHFHCLVKEPRKGVSDTYGNLQKWLNKNKLIKDSRHSIYVAVCNDEKGYLEYIRKQGGEYLTT